MPHPMHAPDTIDSDASLQNPQQWLLISCCRQNCIIIVCCYIRQGSYVLPLCVCLSVCLSVAMHHLISGINFRSHSVSLAQNTLLMMSHSVIHLPPAHHSHPSSHIHSFIPGSKLTCSTNLFHHSLLAPTWTAFSDYTGPDLLCSTVFFIFSYFSFLFWVLR